MSIAASGPMYEPGQRRDPIGMHPKALADLRYTSADIAYLERHWKQESYDSAPFEYHVAEHNVDYAAATLAFHRVSSFLSAAAAQDSDFDGGSLIFSFSGHGREGDGTLCLQDDTFLSADDFVDACLDIQRNAPGIGSLRVVLLLDSCYSGAFLLTVLNRMLDQHSYELAPEYMLASAMPDEVAWEVVALGHGLSTFCFSVRPEAPGSMMATADGVETTWAIAEGPKGCSLVTGGAQNPVVYDAYRLESTFGFINLWDGEPFRSRLRNRPEWEADLLKGRDRLY